MKVVRGRAKQKKARQPIGSGSTIPITAADDAVFPFEDDGDSYSEEPMPSFSGRNVDVRLWPGPDTNIDDDDDLLIDSRDPLSSNIHDQRLEEEESVDISMDERQIPTRPPPQRDLQPEDPSNVDRLPDRPRRSQPIAGARDSQSAKKQRQPLPRYVAANRPYSGISASDFCNPVTSRFSCYIIEVLFNDCYDDKRKRTKK